MNIMTQLRVYENGMIGTIVYSPSKGVWRVNWDLWSPSGLPITWGNAKSIKQAWISLRRAVRRRE